MIEEILARPEHQWFEEETKKRQPRSDVARLTPALNPVIRDNGRAVTSQHLM